MKAAELQDYVKKNPTAIRDLAYTINLRRAHLKYRSFMISDGSVSHSPSECQEANHRNFSMAYVFTGQGAQWPGMGVELLNTYPCFVGSIHKMEKALQSLPDPPAWCLMGKSRDMRWSHFLRFCCIGSKLTYSCRCTLEY